MPARQVKCLISSTEEDCNKHHTFGQRSEDDRLRPDFTSGIRVAASRFSCFHTDDAHANCGSNRGHANVNSTGHCSK